MLKNTYHKWFLISVLILTLSVIFLPVIYTKNYHELTSIPQVVNAKIDLSKTDLKKSVIYLDGQWEFYWKNLIMTDSGNTRAPDLLIKVPEEWSNYKINNKRLTAEGYASYKLIIEQLSYDDTVTLYIPDFSGAYKIYIDGQLTSESGVVSKDNSKIFTIPKAKLYPTSLSGDLMHEVVIEVATTKFSGLYMTPILGSYDELVIKNNLRDAARLILFGIALFAFINLIAIYLFSVRRKLHSFWMPLMIFLILIRSMLTTEFYSFWQPLLFFGLAYEKTNLIMYLVTFILKYLLIFLIKEQCGIDFSRKEKIGFFIYYIILFVVYLFIPRYLYNQLLSVIIPMLTYVLDIYLFIKVYINRVRLIKFGILIFFGATLVINGLALDSFYINGLIFMNMSIALLFMLVLFMVIMSIIYSIRNRDLYDDFMVSASRLEIANKQISIQKEYYDTLSNQMDEIKKIKHDIRHFIVTMEMLAEEGKIDKLVEFLCEYSEKTKTEELPLFCENIIANSIIGYYYLQASRDAITFESRCIIDKQVDVDDNDLCIVLGNALDNAVSACRTMEPSQTRFVSITTKIINKYLFIKVCNSYQGQLEMKNGQYISSKKGGSHGYGIRNIQKVVESYGGYLKIDHDGNTFTILSAIKKRV
jgi:signal transduction histidine kinase